MAKANMGSDPEYGLPKEPIDTFIEPLNGGSTRRHYGQYSQFGTYYGMVSMQRNMADYSFRKMRVSLRNNLYNTDTEKLIWSATSESVEPKTVREIVE